MAPALTLAQLARVKYIGISGGVGVEQHVRGAAVAVIEIRQRPGHVFVLAIGRDALGDVLSAPSPAAPHSKGCQLHTNARRPCSESKTSLLALDESDGDLRVCEFRRRSRRHEEMPCIAVGGDVLALWLPGNHLRAVAPEPRRGAMAVGRIMVGVDDSRRSLAGGEPSCRSRCGLRRRLLARRVRGPFAAEREPLLVPACRAGGVLLWGDSQAADSAMCASAPRREAATRVAIQVSISSSVHATARPPKFTACGNSPALILA